MDSFKAEDGGSVFEGLMEDMATKRLAKLEKKVIRWRRKALS